MWEKIVLNLLSNAFKFTFEGEIAVSAAAPTATQAELDVRDTGTGIPAAELPQLFERFHRVEGARGAHARRQRHRARAGAGAGQAARRHDRGRRARRAAAARSRCRCPIGSAHLPPSGSAPARRRATSVRAPRPTSTRRCAGSTRTCRTPRRRRRAGCRPARPHAPRIVLADDNADMRDYVRRLLARALRGRGGRATARRRWRPRGAARPISCSPT